MKPACVAGDDDLGDAVVAHLRAIGACLPDEMRAYVTSVSVSQDVESLARVEVSLVLAPSGKKRKKPWIDVKDRLPESDDHVLVSRDEDVRIGVCDEDGVFIDAVWYRQFEPQPTHWMPLPRGVGA